MTNQFFDTEMSFVDGIHALTNVIEIEDDMLDDYELFAIADEVEAQAEREHEQHFLQVQDARMRRQVMR